jgi:PAS domain S-box-containing protein
VSSGVVRLAEVLGDRERRVRHREVLAISVAMFLCVLAARLAWPGAPAPILLLELLPVTLIGIHFGARGGLIAGVVGFLTWSVWATTTEFDIHFTSAFILAPIFVIPAWLIGWFSDLDARTVRRAVESEKDLRFIAEESTDTISTHSPDGGYTYVSRRCLEMLGYTPEELIGTSAYAYFHPDDLALIQASHVEALNNPELTTMTYRSRRKDGAYVWFESRMRTRRDPRTAEVEEIHCATREISALERLAELDRRALDQAHQRVSRCIEEGGPSIAFQPIYHLERRAIVAVEALARFEGEPSQGPDVWFAEAWKSGLGLELELLAIRSAIAGFAALPEEWVLTVNASAETVQADELLEIVGDLSARLVIEVTEHADLADAKPFITGVTRLRDRGVRIAIDDVGTGFSGLSRLLDLDPDVIKLDLSLTRHIDHDDRRGSLTTSLVAFGRDSRIDVVAEGIETEAELEALMARGVRYGQGYYLGRPTQALDELSASATSFART